MRMWDGRGLGARVCVCVKGGSATPPNPVVEISAVIPFLQKANKILKKTFSLNNFFTFSKEQALLCESGKPLRNLFIFLLVIR